MELESAFSKSGNVEVKPVKDRQRSHPSYASSLTSNETLRLYARQLGMVKGGVQGSLVGSLVALRHENRHARHTGLSAERVDGKNLPEILGRTKNV